MGFNSWRPKPPLELTSMAQFKGSRVAVDVSILLHAASKTSECSFVLAIGGDCSDPEETAVARLQMMRTIGVEPIVVLDGEEAPQKVQLRTKRKNSATDARTKLEDALMNGTADKSEILKLCRLASRPLQANFSRLETYMKFFNFRYVKARGEADAVCAGLVKNGYCSAALSTDWDFAIRGALPLIQQVVWKLTPLSAENESESDIQCKVAYSMPVTQGGHDSTGWSSKTWAFFASVCGCDYTSGVRSYGAKKTAALITSSTQEELDAFGMEEGVQDAVQEFLNNPCPQISEIDRPSEVEVAAGALQALPERAFSIPIFDSESSLDAMDIPEEILRRFVVERGIHVPGRCERVALENAVIQAKNISVRSLTQVSRAGEAHEQWVCAGPKYTVTSDMVQGEDAFKAVKDLPSSFVQQLYTSIYDASGVGETNRATAHFQDGSIDLRQMEAADAQFDDGNGVVLGTILRYKQIPASGRSGVFHCATLVVRNDGITWCECSCERGTHSCSHSLAAAKATKVASECETLAEAMDTLPKAASVRKSLDTIEQVFGAKRKKKKRQASEDALDTEQRQYDLLDVDTIAVTREEVQSFVGATARTAVAIGKEHYSIVTLARALNLLED